MKAIVYERFGGPDVLEIRDVDKPVVGDDDVLVQVHATAIDHGTWLYLGGKPFLVRMMAGPFKPRRSILGVDLAGRVEAVGKNVTHFKAGDEVFGEHVSTFAEYVCVPENGIALKPSNLTFEEAAAVPVSGLTALQGLRDHGGVQPGHKIIINGASGGVGSFAVQIGKVLGAEVTGVCSTRNLDLIRSLGADHVIDYTCDDFTEGGSRYDLILDLVGNHSLAAFRRALTPMGTLLLSAGPPAPVVRLMLGGTLLSSFVSQKIGSFVAQPSREDLGFLRELIEAGKVTPLIDRRYMLSEIREAFRHHGEGHARGKKVITVREHHEAAA